MEWDLSFICTNLASLSGAPTRIYRDGSLQAMYSMVQFPVDPIRLHERELLAIQEKVSYLISAYGQFYGVILCGQERIIMGPSRHPFFDENETAKQAFMLGLSGHEATSFVAAVRSIVPIGLESFLRMICLVHYYLNGEKASVADMMLYDESPSQMETAGSAPFTDNNESAIDVHNTLPFEKRMLDYVRTGDTQRLRDLLTSTAHGQAGKVAFNPLRQAKNTLIITATIVSRAAIDGGLAQEESLMLSDEYIQRCEMLADYKSVSALQWRMIMDYTSRVETLRHGKEVSPFLLCVYRYVQKNLLRVIRMDEMADALHMNRSHMATRFKKESGMTLTEFVLSEKISEAKRLMKTTDRTLGEISEYLAFSSQSHFQNAFRRQEGISPGKYRDGKS